MNRKQPKHVVRNQLNEGGDGTTSATTAMAAGSNQSMISTNAGDAIDKKPSDGLGAKIDDPPAAGQQST